ncbi:transforming acidic coiled-coil-containing protein 2-like isoform X2 [Solea solea]|uniref:transforming acidic coiled-coil-containing protein 2-like isoform X2 n=1 Tax=Solea solea TaxID=90069 RepID=UPI00272C2C90|nr:transforming acidic coiled-coil-containing protein 2-like isoform X2 [Solea solea]
MGGTNSTSPKKSSKRGSSRSRTSSTFSDSEGNFGTPEAVTPVRTLSTIQGELENNNTDADRPDLDEEEHLIVTAPVEDQDSFPSHSMGQDEPAVPMGGPLEINMQTLEAEQADDHPEASGSVPVFDSPLMKATPQLSKCTALPSELTQAPATILVTDPILDLAAETAPTQVPALAPAPAPAPFLAPAPAQAPASATASYSVAVPASTPEPTQVPHSELSSEPAPYRSLEPPEEKRHAVSESESNGSQSKPQKTKTNKSKCPSLKTDATLNEITQTNEEQERPVPKDTYNCDHDQLDNISNPFTRGGSKIPNSPLEEKPHAVSGPESSGSHKHTEPTEKTKTTETKPASLKMEDTMSEDTQTNEEHEHPIPKATYNFDPDQLDNISNPFTRGGSKIPNSPSEEKPPAISEPASNDSPKQSKPTLKKTKTSQSKPPSLKMDATLNEIVQASDEQEYPVSKATYNFEPDQLDNSFNPFTMGGSKIPNSPSEEKPPAISEPASNDSPKQSKPTLKKTKTSKSKPPSLKMDATLNEIVQASDEQEHPVSKATYNFETDQLDNSFNPFTMGGSKIPNSPSEEKPPAISEPASNDSPKQSKPTLKKTKTSKSKPPSLKMDATLNEIVQASDEQEHPVSKATYNFEPDQLDNSFNPFTMGGSKIPNSPSEEKPPAISELESNSSPKESQPTQKTKTSKSKSQSLETDATLSELSQANDGKEIMYPKATYNFDPDQLDSSINPLTKGGSKIPNSPSEEKPPAISEPASNDSPKQSKPTQANDGKEIMYPKATYNFDPDQLDSSINPLTKGGSKIPNSPSEEKPPAISEPASNDSPKQSKPTQKTKTSKSKPPSLKMDAILNEIVQANEEQELPVPKATYNLDLDQLDSSFNPFTKGGSKIPNSPSEEKPPAISEPASNDSPKQSKPTQKTNTGKSKPPSLKMDATLNEIVQASDEQDHPVSKATYNVDLDQLDNSFNPFTKGGSKIPNSPSEEIPPAISEPASNDSPKQSKPTQKTKTSKSMPQSLKTDATLNEIAQDQEHSFSKATYNFEPDQQDDSFNPLTRGGSEIHNSPCEDKPHVVSEPESNGFPEQTEPIKKTKTIKSKPPCLKMETTLNEIAQANEEQELPVPKATYNFDPDQLDNSFNPFTSGGSKIQNSPPPCGSNSLTRLEPLGSSLPVCERSTAAEAEVMEPSSETKPVMLEFSLDEGKVSKPPPRKLGGKKTTSKFGAKKQRPKGSEASCKPAQEPTVSEPASQPIPEPVSQSISEPVSDPLPETALPVSENLETLNLDDIPTKSGAYNFDPTQWDDPDFNPFGSNSKVSSSPVLPKGSYSFDPDTFDDSVDPFKPSKSLSTEDSSSSAAQPEKMVKDGGKQKAGHLSSEKKVRQIPKKGKEKTITNSCKVQKYDESQSLVLDVCNQEEDEVVVQTPEITQRVHHATDEEKLASTGITGQITDPPDERGEPEYKKAPVQKQPISDDPEPKLSRHQEEKETCSLKDDISEISMKPTTKVTSSDAGDAGALSQDTEPLSEMDKAAVLTLIREEIITKEIEVSEWKRKYEESRAEVFEMRTIVGEYEKTVAQMIEDEQQQKSLSCSKSVRQLTLERDQAVDDLNSVERSLADLFRRYENLKGVLEGFKKNEEVLKKCAHDNLMRLKQEEQRYQTLKVHAEEKLNKAYEEIAHVRAKADSEGVALSASLRKEQMKVESLESSVHQKNQEIEELTKICDELIAKLGTH